MKMNFLIFILLNFSIVSYAKTGGVDGGGGRSIVCRNADGSIKSAEILDLYEGRALYRLNYIERTDDWTSQIDNILKSSGLSDPKHRIGYSIIRRIPVIKEKMHLLPDDVQLNDVDDSNEAIAPVGCKIEQAVNYISDNLILFNGMIWKSLSQTQKAALVLHEAIYRELRSGILPEKNSTRSRHFNAFLFSGGLAEPSFDYNHQPPKIISCEDSGTSPTHTSFYAYKNSETNKTEFYFTYLNGRQMLTKLGLTEYEMHGGDPSLVFDQLLKPTGRTGIQGRTLSAFESNDRISITLSGADEFGPARVYLLGFSSLDNSEFSTYLQCY